VAVVRRLCATAARPPAAPCPRPTAGPRPVSPRGAGTWAALMQPRVRPRCPRLSPLGGRGAGHRHRAGPGRRADPPRPRRTRTRPGGARPRPTRGPDRGALPLGQTRSGSRSPEPPPASLARALTMRPALAQDGAGSAGAREVAARPHPRGAAPRWQGTLRKGGRPGPAAAEMALIVPSMHLNRPSPPIRVGDPRLVA
jgi:hypothetical protein